jgi:hypothetical protein
VVNHQKRSWFESSDPARSSGAPDFSGSSSTRSAVATTKTVSRPRREQPRDVATHDAVSAHDADDDRIIQHL